MYANIRWNSLKFAERMKLCEHIREPSTEIKYDWDLWFADEYVRPRLGGSELVDVRVDNPPRYMNKQL